MCYVMPCRAAYPDVIEKPLTSEHEFVVLACDGIWDVLTNQEVVDFVRARIAQRMEPDTVRMILCICVCVWVSE